MDNQQTFPFGGFQGAGQENLKAILAALKQAATSSDPSNDSASLLSGSTPPPTVTPPNYMANMGVPPASAEEASSMGMMPPTPSNIPPPEAPTSKAPDMGMALKQASQTPPTDYSQFKDLGADDRLNLAKSILAKQQSGGNAAIGAVAGLGDALARSYGHDKQADSAGAVRGIEQKQGEEALGAVDTARQQKMQDFDNHIKLSMNDPASSLSNSMRDFAKQLGMNVPSGLAASQLVSVMVTAGDMLLKRAIAEETAIYHRMEIGLGAKKAGLEEKKAEIEHPIGTRIYEASHGEEKASSGGWKVKK